MGQFEKDSFEFWDRRSLDARVFCIMLNFSNSLYQLQAVIKPLNSTHLVVNLIYSVGSITCFAAIYFSFKNPMYLQTLMFGCCSYLLFRNAIRLWDFEQTKQEVEPEDWYYLVVIQNLSIGQLANIIYNFFYSSGSRNLVTLFLYLTYIGSNLAAIYGKEDIVQHFFEKIFLFIFGSLGMLYFIWILRRIN